MDQRKTGGIGAARSAFAQRGRVGMRSVVVVLLIIGGLAGLGWFLSHRGPAPGAPGMPGAGPGGPGGPGGGPGGRGGMSTTVGVAKVESQDIDVTLEALGTVTPAATVTVRPQVSGVITAIRFKEGQMVGKGQVLAVVDPRPFRMALQQAQGQLARDEAELENGKLQLQRFKTLQGQDSIAQQDVDAQVAAVKQLEGTVTSDRAAVATAQLDLDYSDVKTPVAGRVGLRVIDEGNYIGAGDAAGIAVVTQVAPTDVVFTVPQDRVPEIQGRVSKGATIPVLAMDRTRLITLGQGTFSTLDNVVSVDTGTVRAKARFANADGALFPSQFVNVRLTLDTIRGAAVAPVSAVRNGSEGDFVWLLQDDRTVTERKVRRGQTTGDRVQILEGVAVGDTLITEGGDRLKEGGKVVLPGDKPAAPEAQGADAPNAAKHGDGQGPGARERGAQGGERKWEHRRRRDQEGGSGEPPKPGTTPPGPPPSVAPGAPAPSAQ